MPAVSGGAAAALPGPRRHGGATLTVAHSAAAIGAIKQLAGLAALAGLIALRGSLPAEVVLVIAISLVPGWLLLQALGLSARAAEQPVYLPASSLVVLMGSGLAVDVVGHAMGLAAPLQTWPLAAGCLGACAGLVVLAVLRGELSCGLPRPPVGAWSAWPLLLPVSALVGAQRLNNGQGGTVAVVAAAGAVALLLLCVIRASRWSPRQIGIALYAVALTAEWSFSARSSFVYGYDITSEYFIAHSTAVSGYWNPAASHGAYQAMLSITVLPSMLRALTGVPVVALFKYVYPMLFAGFAVGVFWLVARFARRTVAAIAAGFVVSQTYFFEQLPQLARQEVALLLFLALVSALLMNSGRRAWALVAILAVGVVVGHYSTTYVAIALLLGGALLQLVIGSIRREPRITGTLAVGLVAMAGGAAVWYGAVTHSTANLGHFESSFRAGGLDLLPNRTAGEGLLASYLKGNVSGTLSATGYQNAVAAQYQLHRSYVHPLPQAKRSSYALRPAEVAGSEHSAAVNDAQTVVSQVANLLLLAGALWLIVCRGRSSRLFGYLSMSTLGMLIVVRLSGTVAVNYNQSRALVQTLVPLSVGLAVLLDLFAGPKPSLRQRLVLGLAGVSVAFLLTDGLGLLRPVTGTEQTNVASGGEDYQRFYITAPELDAASWVGQEAGSGQLVYADRYGSLRYLAATGRDQGLLTDITPRTLDQDAWVYASRVNTVDGIARGAVNDNIAVYRFPRSFLNAYYATVYDNGQSQVFR